MDEPPHFWEKPLGCFLLTPLHYTAKLYLLRCSAWGGKQYKKNFSGEEFLERGLHPHFTLHIILMADEQGYSFSIVNLMVLGAEIVFVCSYSFFFQAQLDCH